MLFMREQKALAAFLSRAVVSSGEAHPAAAFEYLELAAAITVVLVPQPGSEIQNLLLRIARIVQAPPQPVPLVMWGMGRGAQTYPRVPEGDSREDDPPARHGGSCGHATETVLDGQEEVR